MTTDLFKLLKDAAHLKINPDKIFIEDPIFRAFSKITVGILSIGAILVTLSSVVGEKLKCILPPKEDISPGALEQYCFIMSTYTVPNLYNRTVGKETAHWGVGPHSPEHDEQRYHFYYQWVPMALFFQAMTFLVPHLLWKMWDGNKIQTICDLNVSGDCKLKQRGLVKKDDASKLESLNRAAVYFVGHISYNNSYAIFFILCEVLNVVIVALNFWFTDVFLANQFHNYGPRVLGYLNGDPDSPDNPMNEVFPKVAKCDFHKYGPSGNIVRYDILCVLALNIINEKIYLFCWFWFVILMIIGGLQLIYRLVLVLLPGLRNNILKKKVARKYQSSMTEMLGKTGYPEWFLLQLLSVNIDTWKFGELCEQINSVLYQRSPNGRVSSASPDLSYTKNDYADEPFIDKHEA